MGALGMKQLRLRAANEGRGSQGFSIVEVMIGMSILIVSVMGMVASVVSSAAVGQTNNETAIAHQAARAALEDLQGTAFSQVFATFNDNPEDDPAGPGSAVGSGFTVTRLDTQAGDGDTFVGRFVFPTGGGLTLREDIPDQALGTPRDLNADGVIDAADHSGDYVLLPVQVVIEWSGISGTRQLGYETLLSNR